MPAWCFIFLAWDIWRKSRRYFIFCTNILFSVFTELETEEKKVSRLKELIDQLPENHYTLLQKLMCHLKLWVGVKNVYIGNCFYQSKSNGSSLRFSSYNTFDSKSRSFVSAFNWRKSELTIETQRCFAEGTFE